MISNKEYYWKKEEKHKEFTVVNKGKEETKRQKQPLIYSNRRQKIQKGRTIRFQTTESYTSIKNELSDRKVIGDPQIPHCYSTNNNGSPKGDHEA